MRTWEGSRGRVYAERSSGDLTKTLLLLLILALVPLRTEAADTPATFTGPSSGAWNTATNWSGGVVPANVGATTFAVTIPDNIYVFFDRPGATTVNTLTLAGPVSALQTLQNDSLTVVNQVINGGTIFARQANFTASGAISGSGSLEASLGGILAANGLTTYTPGYGTYLSAADANSKLNITGLTTLDLGASNNWINLQATGGAVVDAHNLSSITGTSTIGAPIRIAVDGAGSLFNVAALNAIPNDTASILVSGGGTFQWGNVTSLQGATLDKRDPTSVINTSLLNNINRSNMYARSGATIALPAVTSYTPAYGNELRAENPSSKLDLSALTTLALGASSNWVNFQAFNGGTVDAHNLATITGSSTTAQYLRLVADGAGSVLNVTGLTSYPSNSLQMTASNGATVLWSKPANLDLAAVSVANGATLDLSNLTTFTNGSLAISNAPASPSALNSLTGSSVYIGGGANVSLPALTSYTPGYGSELRADGAGTKLQLNSLTTLAMGNTNNWTQFEAYNGGTLDAHNLATISGTTSVDDFLRITSTGAGSIVNISGLVNCPSDSLSINAAEGGTVLWAKPATLDRATIALTNNAVLDTSNLGTFTNSLLNINNAPTSFTALANANGSSFNVLGGSTVTFPAVTSFTPGYGSVLHADGTNSKLVLPALAGINLGAADHWIQIQAFNGGTVDLHNLTSLQGTSTVSVPFRVSAQGSNSMVDLSALSNIPDGTTVIDLRYGGTLLWGNPATFKAGVINRTNATNLNTASLTNIDATELNAYDTAVSTFPSVVSYTPGYGTAFRADSNGAAVRLSALTTLNFGAADHWLQWQATSGATIDAHSLTTIIGASTVSTPMRLYADGVNSTINLAALHNIPDGVFSLDLRNGATLLWNNPTTLTGANISRYAATTLDTSALASVDGSNLYAYAGAIATYPAIASYTPGYGTNLHAEGDGTHLNFPALTTINLGAADHWVQVQAYSGGPTIDAHNLTTITGTSTVANAVRVYAEGVNAKVDFSALSNIGVGTLSLDLRNGATFLWNPTVVQGAIISRTGLTTLNTAALTNVDGSTFYTYAGANTALPSVSVYTPGYGNTFHADGVGSKLDLSALNSINLRAADHWLQLQSFNGGIIDAHNALAAGASAVSSPIRPYSTGAGSLTDLSRMSSGFPVGVGYNYVGNLQASGGGTIRLNDYAPSDNPIITGNNASLVLNGSLALSGFSSFYVDSGAGVSLKRDLSMTYTNEGQLSTSAGSFTFNGSGVQRVEAGGMDVGIAGVPSLANDNFSFGRLIVGQAGQPTIVDVRDDADNGNRQSGGATPEALYLFGIRGRTGAPQGGDPDAVDILGGSTLLIRNLNVYALQGGALVNLQSLFPPGQRMIPYKGGYLSKAFSAVPGAWNVDNSGDWNVGANWLLNGVPNGAGAPAIFGDKITAARTVTLNSTVTVGLLGFDGSKSYTLSGSGAINLTNAGGARASIHVASDSGSADHTVNLPLNLQADLDLTSYSANTLTLAGAFNNPGGRTIIKDGPGTIAIAGPQNHAAGTQIVTQAGTLRLDSDAGSVAARPASLVSTGGNTLLNATQHLNSIKIAGGVVSLSNSGLKTAVTSSLQFGTAGQLDLGNRNSAVIDYDAADGSPIAAIRNAIISGRFNGPTPWTGPGVVSSSAASNTALAVGYGEASALLGAAGGTFTGQGVDGTSVLLRATLGGDTNLDGVVNFTDLVNLAQNYNANLADPNSPNKTESWWLRGDFNYDANVTFPDLVALAQNYGKSLPSQPIPGAPAGFQDDLSRAFAAAVAVPEPAFFAWFCPLLLARRRRRRRSGRGRRSGI